MSLRRGRESLAVALKEGLLLRPDMFAEEGHHPGTAAPLVTPPRKDDEAGAAARSSTGAQPMRHWAHWPNRSVRWLLVGLVAAAVAITLDRTVFSGGARIPTTSSIAPI